MPGVPGGSDSVGGGSTEPGEVRGVPAVPEGFRQCRRSRALIAGIDQARWEPSIIVTGRDSRPHRSRAGRARLRLGDGTDPTRDRHRSHTDPTWIPYRNDTGTATISHRSGSGAALTPHGNGTDPTLILHQSYMDPNRE